MFVFPSTERSLPEFLLTKRGLYRVARFKSIQRQRYILDDDGWGALFWELQMKSLTVWDTAVEIVKSVQKNRTEKGIRKR